MCNKTFHTYKTIYDIGYCIIFNDIDNMYKSVPYYDRNPLDPLNYDAEITPVTAIDLYKNLRIAATTYQYMLDSLIIYDPE